MNWARPALLSFLVALASCRSAPEPLPEAALGTPVAEAPAWRAEASAEDAARIDTLDDSWNEALAVARRDGFARRIASEGRLLQPYSALSRPAPSPGNYLCRWIRFRPSEARDRAFSAYRPFFCHVGADEDLLYLTKQTGSDRPSGYLFEDSGNRRMIFLGSLALGDEEAPSAYGEDPDRDLAGVLERIGPLRFRLVIPRPRSGALLEVVELTPAPVQLEE